MTPFLSILLLLFQSSDRLTDRNAAVPYNAAISTLVRDDALWQELGDSLVRCRPSKCRDANRPDIILELQKSQKERDVLLQELLKVDSYDE
jgi:hypothetical protein